MTITLKELKERIYTDNVKRFLSNPYLEKLIFGETNCENKKVTIEDVLEKFETSVLAWKNAGGIAYIVYKYDYGFYFNLQLGNDFEQNEDGSWNYINKNKNEIIKIIPDAELIRITI